MEKRMNDIASIQNQLLESQDEGTFNRLMTLRREHLNQEAKKEFMVAFSFLQAALPSVKKSGKASFKTKQNGQVQYSFVKIDDLTEALKPIICQHGFSFMFRQKEIHDRIAVCCVVMHVSGHQEVVEMTAPVDNTGAKNHLQAIASTVSYLKRLTFVSAFGVSVTDEDPKPVLPRVRYYSDNEFKVHFPHWRLLIAQGKQTPQSILTFLESRGIQLSPEQKQAINSC